MYILLHTNDFHNHLTAAQADYLRQLRQTVGSQGLLLDAGDAVASGNITFRPGGETILKTMSAVPYDALTVGNREFHVSRMGFHAKTRLAQFPVLCANVRRASQPPAAAEGQVLERISERKTFSAAASVWKTEPLADTPSFVDTNSDTKNAQTTAASQTADPPALAYIVRDLRSPGITPERPFRIVIFGLTVPMITERMLSRKASAYIFEPPIDTARRLAPYLQQKYAPDLLVALTHIGYPQDCKLAEAVPGIDLIVGGHSHTRLEEGTRVGNTLIVQTGCFAHQIGCVIIQPTDAELSEPAGAGAFATARPRLRAFLLPFPKQPDEQESHAQIHALKQMLAGETETTSRP